MPFYLFQWTDLRLEKLELNGVDREDFESIVMNPMRRVVSRSSGRPMAIGYTASGDLVACVYELHADGITVLPITAYFI